MNRRPAKTRWSIARNLTTALAVLGAFAMLPGQAAATTVSNVSTVTLSTTAAGATGVSYGFTFNVSGSGALTSGVSTITISGPTGIALPQCLFITDTTTGASAASACASDAGGNPTETYLVNVPVANGNGVQLQLDGVTNPPLGGPFQLSVSTSADTTAAQSLPFSTTTPKSVGGVSALTLSSSAAGVKGVSYGLSFTTSSSGGLTTQSTITVRAPAGTVLPDCVDVTDATAGQALGSACAGDGGGNAQETYYGVGSVPATHQLQLTLNGVTNPPAGTGYELAVSTSSDTTSAATPPYTTGAPQSVVGLSPVTLSSSAASVEGVSYTFSFSTSATGGLTDQSTITIAAPTGTALPDCIFVQTTAELGTGESNVGCTADFGGHATETYPVLVGAASGTLLHVLLTDMTNPPVGSGYQLTVSTSSDTQPGSTQSYATSSPERLSNLSAVTPSSAISGATNVSYVFDASASPIGGLTSNGTITIAAPDGPALPRCVTVSDTTAGTSFGAVCAGDGGGNDTETYGNAGSGALGSVKDGDALQLTLNGLTNPAAGTAHSLTVSSSSDTVPATTAPFVISAGQTVSGSVMTAAGQPYAGAAVDACAGSGSCYTATSGSDGTFTISVADHSSYTVSARGTGDGGSGTAGTVVVAGSSVSGLQIQLTDQLVAAGTTVNGQTGYIPNLVWDEDTTLTLQGCPHGFGMTAVTATDVLSGQPTTTVAALVESQAGSGSYTAVLPPVAPAHGTATARSELYCFGAVSPTAGPSAGGNTVSITGSGFTGATQVMFGSTPATSFTVVSDSLIVAVAPAGTGAVDVTVSGPGGETTISSSDRYEYFTVSSVTFNQAGTQAEVTGTGLNDVAYFVLGGNTVFADPAAETPTQVSLTVPTPDAVSSSPECFAAVAPGETPTDLQNGADWYETNASGSIVSTQPPTDGTTCATPFAFTPPTVTATSAGSGSGSPTLGNWDTASAADWAGAPNGAAGWGWMTQTPAWAAGEQAFGAENGASAALAALAPAGAADVANHVEEPFAPLMQTANFCLACQPTPAPGAKPPLLLGGGGGGGFTGYVDPSGTVLTTNGTPVSGATVTIQSAATAAGPFATVPASSPLIEPNENPETTAADGVYHWDVLPGDYQLAANAPGCTVPGAGATTVNSPPLSVPPAQTGIVLTLACAGQPALPMPTVTSVTGSSGRAAGGDTVYVSGTGFTPTSTVSFGGAGAGRVTFLSPTTLATTAPPGTGTVNVIVANATGSSAPTAADHYTYTAPPVLTGVSPATGPSAGGTVLEISGSGFNSTGVVTLGSVPAAFTVLSDTQLQVTAPAEPAGTIPITVTSAYGTSAGGAAASFVALAAPSGSTAAATQVGSSAATLNANVNPAGGTVSTCRFDYGTSTAYGQTVACGSTPTGSAATTVSAPVTGLTAATTYHDRIVLSTPGGTLTGQDQAFTTSAAGPSDTPPGSPPTGSTATTGTTGKTTSPEPKAAAASCRIVVAPNVLVKRITSGKLKKVTPGAVTLTVTCSQAGTVTLKPTGTLKPLSRRQKPVTATLPSARTKVVARRAKPVVITLPAKLLTPLAHGRTESITVAYRENGATGHSRATKLHALR